MIRVNRPATSTLEFLIASDPSAARLPAFRPAVGPGRRRWRGLFVALLAAGLVLLAISVFLLR